jgi:hypothetical protein
MNDKEPLRVTIIPNMEPIPLRRTLLMVGISVLPIAIAMLMQKPALRAAIVMRVSHTGATVAWDAAKYSQRIASALDRAYLNARL